MNGMIQEMIILMQLYKLKLKSDFLVTDNAEFIHFNSNRSNISVENHKNFLECAINYWNWIS